MMNSVKAPAPPTSSISTHPESLHHDHCPETLFRFTKPPNHQTHDVSIHEAGKPAMMDLMTSPQIQAPPQPSLSFRLRAALMIGRLAASASRLAGRGSGSSIRGKVTLALAPQAFPELIAPRQIAAVTGTNGKTTTTHFLTAAVHASRGIEPDDIVTNADGANLHAGIVSALGQAPEARNAILEVDERVVADVVRQGHPRVLVLLNFSRDQLDRNHELTFLGREWREALEEAGEEGPTVVANAADPLIVWAAQAAHRTVWVDTKPRWTADSVLCPQCGSILLHDDNGWRCEECGLHQPEADWWVDDRKAMRKDGHEYELEISVPGSFNLANATCALAAATEMGVDPYDALLGMREVSSPAGRYATTSINDVLVRLMLSKNPAGWTESLPLATSDPLILAIDAVAADGKDVSWLWDVDYEQLAGRTVICTGPRALDLGVRLEYAGVDHVVIEDLSDVFVCPLLQGRWDQPHPIDVLATYTPFQKLRRMGEHI